MLWHRFANSVCTELNGCLHAEINWFACLFTIREIWFGCETFGLIGYFWSIWFAAGLPYPNHANPIAN